MTSQNFMVNAAKRISLHPALQKGLLVLIEWSFGLGEKKFGQSVHIPSGIVISSAVNEAKGVGLAGIDKRGAEGGAAFKGEIRRSDKLELFARGRVFQNQFYGLQVNAIGDGPSVKGITQNGKAMFGG